MDISKLKRDKTKVHAALKRLKDGTTVATKPCEIQIPVRFQQSSLASIGNVIEFISIYAIIVDGYYGISTTNAFIRSQPSDTKTVTIGDEDYLSFTYEPGDVVFVSNEVVSIAKIVYNIWNEIVDNGRAPWYLGYDDLGKLFTTSKSHATLALSNHAILEMINSVRVRSERERTKHYRYTLYDKAPKSPYVLGLRNVQYTAETFTAKVGGSYAEIGISSALANDTPPAEGLEEILLS